jgi:hypothetical protein
MSTPRKNIMRKNNAKIGFNLIKRIAGVLDTKFA